MCIALPELHAGGLLRGVGEHIAHMLGIEPQETGRRRRASEQRTEAVRALLRGVRPAVSERDVEPRADVVAERHRTHEIGPAEVLALGDRKGRRHDRTARVEARGKVGIVGLIRVPRHAVGERSIGRRHDVRGADHERLSDAPDGGDVRRSELSGLQPGARQHRGERIENVQPGLRRDRLRERARHRSGNVFRQRTRLGRYGAAGSRAHRFLPPAPSPDCHSGRYCRPMPVARAPHVKQSFQAPPTNWSVIELCSAGDSAADPPVRGLTR